VEGLKSIFDFIDENEEVRIEFPDKQEIPIVSSPAALMKSNKQLTYPAQLASRARMNQ